MNSLSYLAKYFLVVGISLTATSCGKISAAVGSGIYAWIFIIPLAIVAVIMFIKGLK